MLWTNSKPSSSFAELSYANLSDDCHNYDALKIDYKITATGTASTFAIYPKESYGSTSSSPIYRIGLATGVINGNTYYRMVAKNYTGDGTKIFFSNAYAMAGGNTAYNSYCVPIDIYGLKY